MSVRLTLTSIVVASISMGITVSLFVVLFRAALGLIGVQRAKHFVVQVFLLPETHELAEVVHGGRFELVNGCQKRIVTRLAK